ncbi:6181_t:CDS:2 [Diversispora eburnea]|uniref:Snurportin-1 n=1 Tax=Diversispora eburnea TaxID=1213867 RepID=A0A9N9AIX5_9GLOM|nr:6181_t:CDS:2 [Diversispora eburnea]
MSVTSMSTLSKMSREVEENISKDPISIVDQSKPDFSMSEKDKKDKEPKENEENDNLSITIEEISNMLSVNSITAISGMSRQKHYKTSPLLVKDKVATQEERRLRALEDQKKRRRDLTMHARNLALYKPTEVFSDEESEIDEENDLESNKQAQLKTKRRLELEEEDIEFIPKKARHKGRFRGNKQKCKSRNPYRNQIMFAEWMHEIPGDLEENWYVVLCPIGKRCLVVSAKGKTICRLRNGYVMNVFESILPAGSNNYSGNKNSDFCILDCIYDQKTFTYYVLDMMCWKGHPIYDCETEFRFYWLTTKLAEIDTPTQDISTYSFIPLTTYLANYKNLKFLISDPHRFGYRPDGLLFFNKYTQYVFGETPLCGWVGIEKVDEIFSTFLQEQIIPLIEN